MPETNELTRERIQRRAYEIYEERGSGPGNDVDDWLAAERELAELDTAKNSWKGTNMAAEQELQPEAQSQKRQSPTEERRSPDKQSSPIRGLGTERR